MSNFKGYLFKFKTTGKKFPNKYILYNSWTSIPDAREEIKAYRDDNTRNLYRVTSNGTKSSFSFTLRGGLHLTDWEKIRKLFRDAESNHLQRKVEIEYWNDEELDYKTGYVYRANMTPKIKMITENDIIYDELQIDIVEY